MSITRDGIRERQLADLGIHTEVHWHPDDTVTITIPTRALERLIAGFDIDGIHADCGEYDESDLDDARDEGWKDAVKAMEKFAASKAKAS